MVSIPMNGQFLDRLKALELPEVEDGIIVSGCDVDANEASSVGQSIGLEGVVNLCSKSLMRIIVMHLKKRQISRGVYFGV